MAHSGSRKYRSILTFVFAVLVIVASLGSAPPGEGELPTLVTLDDGRVLSLEGDYQFSAIGDMHEVADSYYGTVIHWLDKVKVDIDMSISEQKGKKVTIDKFDITASSYGYDYVPGPAVTTSLKKPAKGKLSLKRQVWKHKVYGGGTHKHDDTSLRLRSALKFRDGTRIQLKAAAGAETADFNYYDYTTQEFELGTRWPFVKEKVSTNMTKGLVQDYLRLDKKARLRMNGNMPIPNANTLSLDITWESDAEGTCIFMAPAHLLGMGGRVKRSANGVITITGPKGYGVKVIVQPDGSGKVNVGFGKWDVPAGRFQLQ